MGHAEMPELRHINCVRNLEISGDEEQVKILLAESYDSDKQKDEWAKCGVPRELSGWCTSALLRYLKLVDARAAAGRPLTPNHSPDYSDPRAAIEWAKKARNDSVFSWRVSWGTEASQAFLKSLENQVSQKIQQRVRCAPIRTDDMPTYELLAGGWEFLPIFTYFPFYLLDERLSGWGVLPFATQRRIGLALREELANSLSINTLIITRERFSEIVKTIERTEDDLRFLHFGVGHAAFRIAMNSIDPGSASFFRRHLYSLDSFGEYIDLILKKKNQKKYVPRNESKQQRDLEHRGFALSTILSGRKAGNPERILIADPGDLLFRMVKKISSESNETDLKFVEVEHELNTPAGLGFSLAALPILLADQAHLLVHMWNAVKESSANAEITMVSGLKEDGLELDLLHSKQDGERHDANKGNEDYILILKNISSLVRQFPDERRFIDDVRDKFLTTEPKKRTAVAKILLEFEKRAGGASSAQLLAKECVRKIKDIFNTT